MIPLNPDALYSRDDLRELFKTFKLDSDAVIARIKPKKVFRCVWLGSDLLDALRSAPALGEIVQPKPRKPGRPMKTRKPQTDSLDAYLQENRV